MATALINGKVFDGTRWLSQATVVIEGKKIVAVDVDNQLTRQIDDQIDLQGKRLVAGFIDTQINGGGGVLFNDSPTVDALKIMGDAHRRYGTTGFFPTLISDDLTKVASAIAAVDDAIEQQVPGILGIHLEGPFLNPARKGVHNANKFRRLDEDAIELISSLKRGKTILTLAPELTTPAIISQLTQTGILVAAGHSAATYDETKTALTAGLRSFTHLFNAMTPLNSREPGMVGAALENPDAWCGIIVDGFHVHPATLKVAHRAKTKGKIVLVTDAMPSAGCPQKAFTLNGEPIYCNNGKLCTADGTLAGSDLTMMAAVQNTIHWLDIELEEAIRMASLYPAEMAGLDAHLGAIAVGRNASMIAVDEQFEVTHSWIDGICRSYT